VAQAGQASIIVLALSMMSGHAASARWGKVRCYALFSTWIGRYSLGQALTPTGQTLIHDQNH